jgi:ribosomal protein S18 acetylase RimI-like enzyme
MDSSLSLDIWERMRLELQPLFNDAVDIVYPQSLTAQYQNWFWDIEAQSFRESLRYDIRELEKRFKAKNVLLLFIVVNHEPEGVILGYKDYSEERNIFYLDTIAVKTRGMGIGRIMVRHLIEWAKACGYTAIVLDTEEVTEIGIPLVQFYKKLGFVIQNIEDDGNITMSFQL